MDEALEILLAGARPVSEVEQVSTMAAVDRVLARNQTSTMDVPPMDNSAMDGYAVRLSDLNSSESMLQSHSSLDSPYFQPAVKPVFPPETSSLRGRFFARKSS